MYMYMYMYMNKYIYIYILCIIYICIYTHMFLLIFIAMHENTLWEANMAMESGPCVDDVPIKDGGFPWFSIVSICGG